jgi:hypothetical protein
VTAQLAPAARPLCCSRRARACGPADREAERAPPHSATRCLSPPPPAHRAQASADEGGSLSDSEQRRAQSLFSKLDSNADGKLDLKEFTQVVIKLIRARGEPARSSQWLRTLFERVDVDADGLVECDELIAAVGMLFAEPDPHATGRLRTAQSSPGSLATPSMMSEPGEGSPGPSRAVSAEPCAAGADL